MATTRSRTPSKSVPAAAPAASSRQDQPVTMMAVPDWRGWLDTSYKFTLALGIPLIALLLAVSMPSEFRTSRDITRLGGEVPHIQAKLADIQGQIKEASQLIETSGAAGMAVMQRAVSMIQQGNDAQQALVRQTSDAQQALVRQNGEAQQALLTNSVDTQKQLLAGIADRLDYQVQAQPFDTLQRVGLKTDYELPAAFVDGKLYVFPRDEQTRDKLSAQGYQSVSITPYLNGWSITPGATTAAAPAAAPAATTAAVAPAATAAPKGTVTFVGAPPPVMVAAPTPAAVATPAAAAAAPAQLPCVKLSHFDDECPPAGTALENTGRVNY